MAVAHLPLQRYSLGLLGLIQEICKLYARTMTKSYKVYEQQSTKDKSEYSVHDSEFLKLLFSRHANESSAGFVSSPIITYSNHISVLDDPLMWGWLPRSCVMSSVSRTTRWVLGAQEIMFSSPFKSFFAKKLKVIPIVRGLGLNQPGMETVQDAMKKGDWIHIFTEGRVSPSSSTLLLPFRWGIGHLIMSHYSETRQLPHVIPIALKGIDDVLPLDSVIKLPRLYKTVEIAIGKPIERQEMMLPMTSSYSAEKKRSALTKLLALNLLEIHGRLYSGQITNEIDGSWKKIIDYGICTRS
jgi:1-acyl-sn-glycerol-3-phosphate acyltransferase